jgi:proteic killer suppression protein
MVGRSSVRLLLLAFCASSNQARSSPSGDLIESAVWFCIPSKIVTPMHPSIVAIASCSATRYNARLTITTFKHKGLEQFFKNGSKAGIQPVHAAKLSRVLGMLNEATEPAHMDVPGFKYHSLTGDLKGHWSVWVNGNWRITFTFEGMDAVLVDYLDYH